MRKRSVNEFRRRPPRPREIEEAQKLAKKVSKELYELMEAKTVEVKVVKGGE